MDYPWGHDKRYNDFSTYFRKKFDGRVQKVSVDAGFSCPNRDGTKGTGGCSYCNNKTFKPGYCNLEKTVTEQVKEGIDFFARKYNSMQFLAYFQAYSNTYAPLKNLKALYEEALQHPKIIGLVIATRPDCLNEEILDYLGELSLRYYVMLEFGVESHRNETLRRINRGHSYEESAWALKETARRGIHTCAHLILGLPGEGYSDFIDQAKSISQLPVENLKLHQLQIHRGTQLYKDYRQNSDGFHIFSVGEYTDLVIDYLEVLNPAIVVERFVSEAPAEMVIAPKWGLKNFEFVAKVEKRLAERDTWQGRLFRQ
ncbi:MAG: TIGR01212 family radical SAM protein [Bacteroidetes bacterium GWF2_42_66]|nr:MAG: TIGR01212 family radical SAM protein [Bacteroidetes bacterium GWA2_42_15]OFY03261.1 MAG: TIGR01212 family radical SAM protein [Bacteroidetes bacterium GWE2_42_39]OFY45689.1 MAG: TIGR01212 family radical SAM protein [Bacteroidetes bacterium GWF2_42_66]HBL77324.1 TIGR01212 family radical SAM protein [Prolixibacteraceae bacterium]HCR91931.1 TIGR01212 family radical SAM protein [Prolixibacteraceae bacterium]